MKKLLFIILAMCLVLSACDKAPASQPGDDPETQVQPGEAAQQGGETETDPVADIVIPPATANGLKAVSSYGDVYKALAAYSDTRYSGAKAAGGVRTEEAVETQEMEAEFDSASAAEAPMEVPMAGEPEYNGMGAADEEDYSGTNVQTEGVDEADVIKTNGQYIYYLSDNKLSIIDADGYETETLSEITVFDYEEAGEDDGDNRFFNDMYLVGDKLILIGQGYNWKENTEQALAVIYDVSDPTAPVEEDTIGQSGYINTTRLVDGILYMISTEYVYDWEEDDPDTFIPCVTRGGSSELVAVDDICIPEQVESTSWLTVSSFDAATGDRIDTKTMLGEAGTVYVSANNIYVADVTWNSDESEPYTVDQYTVKDYYSYSKLDIYKFSYDAGQIEYLTTGALNGRLMNQFSMDERDGRLRVVTTSDYDTHKEYHDEKHDFYHYEWGEGGMTNGLYVLDENLNVIGSVDKLAEDEQVYSCRFIGDVGYFVTFRQTDPLFAVDVSDPANPVVLSELKITGFSEYLHPWGDGLLLGLGMEADEEGRTQTMKLSMFDVSDPKNVTEKDKLVLPYYYSEALYNHHAIFVDVQRGLIGFGADDSYVVYQYDAGFRELAKRDNVEYSWNMRGVRIGNYLYIVDSEAINVIEL